MNSKTVLSGELIYEADIRFTGMIEYGTSMEEISSGKIQIPPQGMRFDQVFEGQIIGPKLFGKITGTDYLHVRADGLFQLHLHARVLTEDGVNIAFSSTGVSMQIESEPTAQIRASVSLFTSVQSYKWVNYLQLWALGPLDAAKGTAFIKAYAV